MTHSTRSSTKFAGMLAIAAAVAMPALAVPAMAQTAPKAVSPAAPMTPTTKAPMDKTPAATTTTTEAVTMTHGDRASKIIGAGVMNEAKETVGTVDDLIITQDEKVPTAVLSVGGFLGIGTKYVAVPFTDIEVSSKGVMMPGATKASLKALPEFNYDK